MVINNNGIHQEVEETFSVSDRILDNILMVKDKGVNVRDRNILMNIPTEGEDLTQDKDEEKI